MTSDEEFLKAVEGVPFWHGPGLPDTMITRVAGADGVVREMEASDDMHLDPTAWVHAHIRTGIDPDKGLKPASYQKTALDWITGTRFEIGDIVTRSGDDLQRVIDIDDDGSSMLVECIRAPQGYLNDDGSEDEPWCSVGDQEWNLPRRYSYPEFMTIDGEAAHRERFGITESFGKTRMLTTRLTK
ncbi:hypothetical protein [Rhizobium leguminosarum]|uniref:hypothetical protein n=1 Tax=Rhizobium leguminosarum TaxID=384 RepID=UPI001C953A9D|nr:hypothetical protein [Rhizobium leguminosarum]MBY5329570.1 hypothetical protein [Rhizobium leguminosarum]